MAVVHLYTLGTEVTIFIFQAIINNPSKIAELQELEHMRTRFDIVALQQKDSLEAMGIKKHFKLDEQEIDRIIEEISHLNLTL